MKYIILFFLLVSASLSAQSITAHRGASYDAPQNTIAAFELAWKQGADFIEGDFYLTKDKEVVCFHDRDTGKLADKKMTVEKSNWEDLKKLDVGYKKGKKWKGTRMPLLKEVLEKIPDDKGIFIEIKSGVSIVPYIKKIIEASNIKKSQIHFICFKEAVIRKCKEMMPDIKAQWLVSLKVNKKSGKANYSTEQLIDKLKKLKADGVGSSYSLSQVTAANVKKLQQAGFCWNVCTINKTADALALKKAGVDFISTDRPQYIRQAIK